MKDEINADTIREMSKLARITVPDDDIPILVEQFKRIIEIFASLEKIDTSNRGNEIPSVPFALRFREDVEKPGLDVNDALKASPRRDGRFIKVPRIIDDGGEH